MIYQYPLSLVLDCNLSGEMAVNEYNGITGYDHKCYFKVIQQ